MWSQSETDLRNDTLVKKRFFRKKEKHAIFFTNAPKVLITEQKMHITNQYAKRRY